MNLLDSDKLENFQIKNAKILAIGLGGAGCNTINMLTKISIDGGTTIAANTDAKHLQMTQSQKKILLGKELTRGLGAGGDPEIGFKAAQESKEEIKKELEGCNLLFLTCGLGGGTGTGSAPFIASIAKELDIIVIATVTMPFKIEGIRKFKAEQGLNKLKQYCDTIIVIENQKLINLAGNKPIKEAFSVSDELIANMIKGITETISKPSLVNLDYADVKSIMQSGGVSTIGIGTSSKKENRAKESVESALNHPLLDIDYKGAKGALIQIIGGDDMKLDEIGQIGEIVSQHMDPEASVMWGARILPEFKDRIQVITIITGVKSPYIIGKEKGDLNGNKKTNDIGIEIIP